MLEALQRQSIAPFSNDSNQKLNQISSNFGSMDELDNERYRPGSPLLTGSGAGGGAAGGMAPLHKQVKRVSWSTLLETRNTIKCMERKE